MNTKQVQSIVKAPENSSAFDTAQISGLSLKDQVLFEQFGQGPLVDLPFQRVHYGFEKFAKTQPQAVAVDHLGRTITYGELNRQANQLSLELIQRGIGPGDYVGLFLERSIEMVIGIFAILKTGAAYIPQDARITPSNQLRHILNTAQAKVVLTVSHLKHKIPLTDEVEMIAIDELNLQSKTNKWGQLLPIKSQPEQDELCFLLFTSGTTGMPNGVKVSHENVINIINTAPGNLGIRPGLKVSQILNISFDMSAWETLGALTNGATLLIRGKDIGETTRKADVIIATPSVLGGLDPEKHQNVKVVAVAGEPCPQALADRWSEFCNFHNSCGPTETTIINTLQPYSPVARQLTIGRPTPNNTVYILNEDLMPCKIGEIGEMWAGGKCVTKGYINNDALTNERYRPDPFLGGDHVMFRTRDLGRWTRNGELQHFGRTDDQVKIKGFRVELDSISTALESVSGCKQAVSLKLDSVTLVSFVKTNSINIERCYDAVQALLPYYCTPKIIIPVTELPRTDRGKIDKRALTQLAVEKIEAADKEQGELK
tara:strand:+ start:86457 stop:88085 length:1629 start_codon:yes stop_codon:yes gene_type:complete